MSSLVDRRRERNRARRMRDGKALALHFNQGQIGHGSAIMSYSGGDNGTYFDSDGVLQISGADEPRLGLLVEEERENIFPSSDVLDFLTSNGASASTAVTAPDGTTSEITIIDEPSSSANKFQEDTILAAVANNEIWTFTVFDQAGTLTSGVTIGINITGGTAIDTRASFNLAGFSAIATFGSPTATSIKDFGDWKLLTITATNNATGNTNMKPRIWHGRGTTGDTNDDTPTGTAYYWGPMCEKGAFSTSVILTTVGAVTRTADIPTNALSDIPIDATDHSGLFKGRTALGGGTQTLMSMDDGTANERIYIERNPSDEIHLIVVDGGVTQADLNLGTVADDTDFKVAYRVAANDYAGSLDGAAVVADTGGTMPTVTTLRWGHNYTSADHWNRTIVGGSLWTVSKGDAQLQALSN